MAATATAVTTTATEQDLPAVFGRYLLIKRLSRGGMGEIFLGRVGEIQGFEKPVIIKKVLPNLAADEEFVKRFIDEAQVAIKLSHANIASVFEVGKVDGDYFLALEYIEGRDLRRLLTRCRQNEERIPPDLCLLIARELANGLGYAHRRTDADGRQLALVHCDISPPNVMVSFEGEVKVIDFGIAKSAIRLAGSNPNMGFGKFGYMAPEQLIRGGVVDKRTDIYAAGVVLYELLTGERLFVFPEGAEYRQMARQVTKGEFIPASQRSPGLDPALDPLIARALAPKADQRYQTAEEFRDAIQQLLYRMNPTISADGLGEFLRRSFAEELDEERALVASTRQVNVDDFKDQLAGSVTHTITFARAGLFGRKERPPSTSMKLPQVGDTSLPQVARKHGLIAIAAAAAMIGGGTIAYLIAKKGAEQRPPSVMLTPPAITNVGGAPVEARPIGPPPSEPVITQLAPKKDDAAPAKKDDGVVAPAAQTSKVRRPIAARPPVVKDAKDAPAAKATAGGADDGADDAAAQQELAAKVQSKFKTVKGEYDAFKVEYGSRLDSDWSAIMKELTFGKSDKYEKVNGMLDGLRREMTKIRKGG